MEKKATKQQFDDLQKSIEEQGKAISKLGRKTENGNEKSFRDLFIEKSRGY